MLNKSIHDNNQPATENDVEQIVSRVVVATDIVTHTSSELNDVKTDVSSLKTDVSELKVVVKSYRQ